MTTSKGHSRFAARAGELSSPGVLTAIDSDLEELKREWLYLLELRKVAVLLHGSNSAPPAMPESREEAHLTEQVVQSETTQQGATTGNISLSSLIEEYQTHERSPYPSLKHATLISYRGLIRRLLKDCGDWPLSDFDIDSIQGLYDGWSENGAKVAMGHAMATMLRGTINFGASILKNPECVRISVVLRTMRFEIAQSRNQSLTREQAQLIIDRAHAIRLPSLALAQAFQIDTALSQKDVIGEWVPKDDAPFSEISEGGRKWARGLRWAYIDDDLVLKHADSTKFSDEKIDLKTAPFVVKELRRLFPGSIWFDENAAVCVDRSKLPYDRPVIVSENTKRPWTPHEFRRRWRIMARDVGIPDNVYNMDSR